MVTHEQRKTGADVQITHETGIYSVQTTVWKALSFIFVAHFAVEKWLRQKFFTEDPDHFTKMWNTQITTLHSKNYI